ncbi:hypothetical protein DUNSADRAFT_1795 [Dunaliella salina]|uniref:Uncharacterized protein n=1 Tax=Dunaliella salina TaxID=3046 RepID=A0ABQ7GWM9_DUNSA|nr:hypothetical protein DUNSADRAFT_1795 [Dunaliella salina]|eukprot:KAF5839018.1 hypothetical protein DUNSADRAFT_1795 [Dunaliella salina]
MLHRSNMLLSVSAHHLHKARHISPPCLLRPIHHSSYVWDEGIKGEPGSTDPPSATAAGTSEADADAQPSTSSSSPSKPPRKTDISLRIKDIATKFKMNSELRSDEGLSNSIGLVPEMRRNQDFQHQLRLAERRLALQQSSTTGSGSVSAMPLEQRLRASLEKYQ